jgi:hypothetical protein
MKIYLDMDGVLTDFEKRYDELFGIRPSEVQERTTHFWRYFETFIERGEFENLEKHKDADKLLQFVHELRVPVEILSSSGGEKHHDFVVAQKLAWLNKNGIGYKANIVPGGSKKASFAKPWHILIDDTQHVVDKYRAAGGTAILHHDIDQTLRELAQLHLEWQGGE